MVVNYLHIERIAAAPDETHTPLIIDKGYPLSSSIYYI